MRSFLIQKILFPVVKVYWKIFKPRTFGVKGLVVRETDGALLLVRHAYGNSRVWNFPGGGYKPSSESAQDAIARELWEELAIHIQAPLELGEYKTGAQGKRDTVTIFTCAMEACSELGDFSDEIAEARWFAPGEIEGLGSLYTITRFALDLYVAGLGKPAASGALP